MDGMRFVIAGSSGFLGTALRERLAEEGHDVTRLVRGEASGRRSSRWDPASGYVDQQVIEVADVVVTLAGAPIIRPWTRARRQAILDSRVSSTNTLATAVAACPDPPAFMAQSGTDVYGNGRGDTVLTESDPGEGSGLLRRVARDCEAAAAQAEARGARVCLLRSGAVLDKRGGAMRAMLPIFRLGLGGRVADGRQYFPVVSLRDWVSAVLHLAQSPDLGGAFNLTGPHPPTNAEFTDALGRALHRPTRLVAPGFVLERALGELAGLLSGSMRAVPSRLLASGFEFADPTVDDVVTQALR
jgi:uncharacterized protein (TIGR01777 family)